MKTSKIAEVLKESKRVGYGKAEGKRVVIRKRKAIKVSKHFCINFYESYRACWNVAEGTSRVLNFLVVYSDIDLYIESGKKMEKAFDEYAVSMGSVPMCKRSLYEHLTKLKKLKLVVQLSKGKLRLNPNFFWKKKLRERDRELVRIHLANQDYLYKDVEKAEEIEIAEAQAEITEEQKEQHNIEESPISPTQSSAHD